MHEIKACPRCGKSFECKQGDITHCQCFGLKISHEEEAYITEKYPDQCLCRDCLQQLQSRYILFLEKEILYKNR